MKTLTILTIIVIIFSSCSQSTDNREGTESNDINNTDEVTKSRCDTIMSEDMYEIKNLILNVTNDQQIFSSPEFKNWQKSSEAVENTHTPGQIDTIYTFIKNNSELKTYKVNSGKSIIFRFQINNSDYRFLNNFSKNEILNKLSVEEINCAILTVESSEVPSYLTFTFVNSKICEIEYNGYLD